MAAKLPLTPQQSSDERTAVHIVQHILPFVMTIQLSRRLDEMQVKQLFPRDGSKATPPHPSADFKWKDYCPMAFKQLREVFNIDAGDYMLSVCGTYACVGFQQHLCHENVYPLLPCVQLPHAAGGKRLSFALPPQRQRCLCAL